jgi:hypothetical protein
MKKGDLSKQIVWKDNIWKNFGIWFFLIASIFFIFITLIVWSQGWISRIGIGIFLVISIYSLSLHLFSTKVALSSSGILTANMKRVKLGVFKVKQKNIFVAWTEVGSISFQNYLSGASWVKYPRPYLIVKTKDGKRYIYVVHDISNFLQGLKKLNKFNLLTKETKEKYT